MRKFIAFSLILTMTLSMAFSFGASIEDLQKQIDEKGANVAEKEAELEQIQAETGSVEEQYWNAVSEIEVLEERIVETEKDIDTKDKAIIKTQAELNVAMEDYNFQAGEFGGRLRKMYLSKDESFWSMIFNSEGFEDLLMRLSNYRRIVKMDEETMDHLNEQKVALEELEDKLSSEMQELKGLKEQQVVDKISLDQKAIELEERKVQLVAMAEEVSNQISAEEAAGYEIQSQMESLIEQARQMIQAEENARQEAARQAARQEAARQEAARQEAANQAQNESSDESGESSDNSSDSSSSDDDYYEEPNRAPSYVGGGWYWPTPGYYYVSYAFGSRVHPLYGSSDFHNGIDILGDSGAPILAARDGLVIYAGWYSGYGNCVIIDHGDGTQSLYGHGNGVATSVGSFVYAGDYIMPMGSTGVSTANHLHFGIMSGGAWVNPSAYVGG